MYITDACNSMLADSKRYQIAPAGAAPSHAHYGIIDGMLVHVADPTGPRGNTNPPQEAVITLSMILSGDWTEITQETKDFFGITDAESPPEGQAA